MANGKALYLGLLMPVWALRMVLVTSIIIMYAVAGALVIVRGAQTYELKYFGFQYKTRDAALATLMALVALALLTLILDIAATILYCCRRLGLATFLVLGAVQSALMTSAFALAVDGYEHSHQGGILALVAIPWLLYLGLAVYALVMYIRRRRRSGPEEASASYEKTPSGIFPDGKLPGTFSTSSTHPVPQSQRSSYEVYV